MRYGNRANLMEHIYSFITKYAIKKILIWWYIRYFDIVGPLGLFFKTIFKKFSYREFNV